MMSRPAFIFLAITAAGAGVWLSWSRYQSENSDPAQSTAFRPGARVRYVADPVINERPPVREMTGPAPAPGRSLPSAIAHHPQMEPLPVTTDAALSEMELPSREELEIRAFKVEQEANHELQNLLGALDLNEEQQDRVFAALARRSSDYHPALHLQNATGGELPAAKPVLDQAGPAVASFQSLPSSPEIAASPSAEADPVIAELAEDRELVARYRDYRDDREAFWAGVVEKIERQLQETGSE